VNALLNPEALSFSVFTGPSFLNPSEIILLPSKLLGDVVTAASLQDRDAARIVFCIFCPLPLSLRVIFAEGGYAGKLEAFVYLALIGHSAVFLISVEPSLKRKA
jgi:hypothetical protein